MVLSSTKPSRPVSGHNKPGAGDQESGASGLHERSSTGQGAVDESDASACLGATSSAGGLRIGDAAARAGVSARTLRYYEELGLLAPSGHTPGGERRYRDEDLARLGRILELRGVLGMNLEDIKRFLDSDGRLDQIREAYRAKKGQQTKAARREQRALLEEALALNEALAAELDAKLARMDEFRSKLSSSARRCRELLEELD